jgi:IS30 family transposase
MTYDRDSEIMQHATLSNHLKINIYFANLHAPWQRSSNENTHGLIRQYLKNYYPLVNFRINHTKVLWASLSILIR